MSLIQKQLLLFLPYHGKKGDHILKLFKKGMRKILPCNVKPRIAFTGRKVGISFQIGDKTEMKPTMILYLTTNAQRNNVMKTTLVKPEEGSVEGL